MFESTTEAFGVTAVETRYEPLELEPIESKRFVYRVVLIRCTGEERVIEFTCKTDSFSAFMDALDVQRIILNLPKGRWHIADQVCRDTEVDEF